MYTIFSLVKSRDNFLIHLSLCFINFVDIDFCVYFHSYLLLWCPSLILKVAICIHTAHNFSDVSQIVTNECHFVSGKSARHPLEITNSKSHGLNRMACFHTEMPSNKLFATMKVAYLWLHIFFIVYPNYIVKRSFSPDCWYPCSISYWIKR